MSNKVMEEHKAFLRIFISAISKIRSGISFLKAMNRVERSKSPEFARGYDMALADVDKALRLTIERMQKDIDES